MPLNRKENMVFGIAGGALTTSITDDMNLTIDSLNKVPVVGSRIAEVDNLIGFTGGLYLVNEASKSLFDMGIDTSDQLDEFMIPFGASAAFSAFGSEMTETIQAGKFSAPLGGRSMSTPRRTNKQVSSGRVKTRISRKSKSTQQSTQQASDSTGLMGTHQVGDGEIEH